MIQLTSRNVFLFLLFVLSAYTFGLGYALKQDQGPDDKYDEGKVTSLKNGLLYGGGTVLLLSIGIICYFIKKEHDKNKAIINQVKVDYRTQNPTVSSLYNSGS